LSLTKKKILLVELSTSHLEILYSQVKILLNSNCEISLFINHKLPFQEKHFSGMLNIYKISSPESFLRIKKQLSEIITKECIDKIIFNTAHGLTVRNLCLYLLFKKVNCFGVLHESEKLFSSLTQKIISKKIKKYFVLSDSVADFCRYNAKPGLEFESFYSIFPPFKKINIPVRNNIIITIPGEVSDNRKDYTGLLKFLIKYKYKIPDIIKIHFLGSAKTSDSRKILQFICEYNLEDLIQYHTEYIPEEKYYQFVQSSDIIMPLIHPDTGSFNEYSASKISGAFNLAFAYRIPLLMHEYFKGHEDFEEISLFYNQDNLLNCLTDIAFNPDLLIKYQLNYSRKTRFSFEFQSKKYLKFLNI
jgi:glycosyltransferase involved in cell wall biosynthesis